MGGLVQQPASSRFNRLRAAGRVRASVLSEKRRSGPGGLTQTWSSPENSVQFTSASAAGGEKTFEVEVEVEVEFECKSRAHPARVPCCIAQSTMLGFVQRTTERKSTTIARRQAK